MKTWREVSARAGRNDLPYLLFVNQWELSEEELREGLAHAWPAAEWPEHALDAVGDDGEVVMGGCYQWIPMFERAGYVTDADEPEPELPERLTLYRGAVEGHETGMSWTADRDRAEWFARRFSGIDIDRTGQPLTGHLWQVEVDREYVLAHFTGRGEDEYVVDLAWVDPTAIEDLGEVHRVKEEA